MNGIKDDDDHNIFNKFFESIALDEINHSSLAWITIKWMIDESIKNGINIDVSKQEWWNQRLNSRKNSKSATYVYEQVIPSILSEFIWNKNGDIVETNDYKILYNELVNTLKQHLNLISCSNVM